MGSLPSLGLRSAGTTTQRWANWRHKNAVIVRRRSLGQCEAEQSAGRRCQHEAEDWHHVFGKRHIIAEPLASHHTMTAALCRECHNAAHRSEHPLLPLLQRAALDRAAHFFFLPDLTEAISVEAFLRAHGEWEALEAAARRLNSN
jgi:hypothetical protein